MKKIISLLAMSSLVATFAMATDFSKKSNEEILNLAKSVSSADQADLVIEMKKRMQDMKYGKAKEFQHTFKMNLRENIAKLSPKERYERKKAVHQDMIEITDKMSGKEIRELNLHGMHSKMNSDYHKAHKRMYQDDYNCPMR